MGGANTSESNLTTCTECVQEKAGFRDGWILV